MGWGGGDLGLCWSVVGSVLLMGMGVVDIVLVVVAGVVVAAVLCLLVVVIAVDWHRRRPLDQHAEGRSRRRV